MRLSSKENAIQLIGRFAILVFVSLVMIGLAELAVRASVEVRNVGPSFTMDDPVYGKRLRPSISVKRVTPEFEMSFSTNEQGFRQPDQVPPDSHPVLFLGDSFTMGYGVNDGEDFVSLIRKQMPLESGPFLNAGMGDNGNGRWLKFLRYDAPRYGPKLVVLQVMGNDFTDNLTERLYAVEDGKLMELPVPKPGPRQWVRSIMNTVPFIANSHLVGLMRQVHVPAIMHRAASDGHSDDRDEVTFKLIDRAIEICEEQGWPALGLTVGVEGERLERLEGLFSERGVRLLGVASRDERPDLYYGIDGHWNAKGHRYAAELLLPEIRSLTNGELR